MNSVKNVTSSLSSVIGKLRPLHVTPDGGRPIQIMLRSDLRLRAEPIPEEFSRGEMIPASVVIYDQFARNCRVPVELWADRSMRNTSGADKFRRASSL
jgi:hypothetical protein